MANTNFFDELTKQHTVTLIKELDVTDLAGEKVMIDFSTGKYFMLKGAGNDIWDYIQEPITVGEIINRLLTEYEVEEATCYQAVIHFLEQLYKNGFLQIS